MFKVQIKGANQDATGETKMVNDEQVGETLVCVTMNTTDETMKTEMTTLGPWRAIHEIAFYSELMREFGKERVLRAVRVAAEYFDEYVGNKEAGDDE